MVVTVEDSGEASAVVTVETVEDAVAVATVADAVTVADAAAAVAVAAVVTATRRSGCPAPSSAAS